MKLESKYIYLNIWGYFLTNLQTQKRAKITEQWEIIQWINFNHLNYEIRMILIGNSKMNDWTSPIMPSMVQRLWRTAEENFQQLFSTKASVLLSILKPVKNDSLMVLNIPFGMTLYISFLLQNNNSFHFCDFF